MLMVLHKRSKLRDTIRVWFELLFKFPLSMVVKPNLCPLFNANGFYHQVVEFWWQICPVVKFGGLREWRDRD